MILTKSQMRTMKIFRVNLTKELSIGQIIGKIGRISRAWLFRFLEELSARNILRKKKLANVNLYSANLDNLQTIHYLAYSDIVDYSFLKFDKEIIDDLVNSIKEDYSLILFGSYTKGSQNKKSDIDICFLIKNKADEIKINPSVQRIKLKSLIDIHEHFVTEDEFVKMLLTEEENLGKQIYSNCVVLTNYFIYFKSVKEAIRNGFKG